MNQLNIVKMDTAKLIAAKNKKNTMIWAFDPTQKRSDVKSLIGELKLWAKQLDCDIQPVSILSNRALNLPVELAFSLTERNEKIGRRAVERYLKEVGLKTLAPEILFISSTSRRKMAAELVRYAERQNALLIFANARTKNMWNPLRLGGFTETLIAISRIPVLLLNPDSKTSTKIPSILFPTDFGRESKDALLSLAPWAKAFGAKVFVYNQLETPAVYMSDFGVDWASQSASLQSMMKDIKKTRQKKAIPLLDILKEQNVESHLLIDDQRKSLSLDILDVAKKKSVKLISLASSTGTVAQTTVGSIARDILLQAKCPVLIFHRAVGQKTMKPKQAPATKQAFPNESQTSVSVGGQHG